MSKIGIRKRGWFDRLVFLVNLFTLLLVLLSYMAGSVSPERFWPLSLLGMAYPALLLITLIFITYWLLKRRWFLFVNIAVLLIKWDYVQSTVQFNRPTEAIPESGIKVVTFNVRLFDYFNWSNNSNTRNYSYDFLESQHPDILCLQEVYLKSDDRFSMLDTARVSNHIKHAHIKNYSDSRTDGSVWGMATLSTYPIVNRGEINFTSTYSNRGIYSDMLINGDTIRIYNIHLQSVRIGEDQYLFLDQIMLTKSIEGVSKWQLWGDLKLLVYRMVHGFIERGKQAEMVAEHVRNCPYPVILCGDFNDTPTSYAYQTLACELNDSFIESGLGIGATYVRIPLFRIDNIFMGQEFTSANHTVHKDVLSDHFAVSAILSKK